ncbi:hypothetical protein K0M31_014723 [Melipona bicolor]|uniref:Uncharacterized protein n=1 Tax=Melipona bicolor TaxID=60889 RepID=A0AA40KFX0_9HYME|nr:hypothetical protein K0M31_014723 [Melipona bicolor]
MDQTGEVCGTKKKLRGKGGSLETRARVSTSFRKIGRDFLPEQNRRNGGTRAEKLLRFFEGGSTNAIDGGGTRLDSKDAAKNVKKRPSPPLPSSSHLATYG